MKVIGPLLLLLALTLSAVGCPQGAKSDAPKATVPASFSQAGSFFAHLLDVARKGDVQAWSHQLSAPRRARGAEYLSKHFKAWRRDLLALDRIAARAEAVIVDQGPLNVLALKHPDGRIERVMRVSFEGRSLRIDEN